MAQEAALLEPAFDLGESEAGGPPDLKAGFAGLGPVDDRSRREAEVLGDLAGAEKGLGHKAPSILSSGEAAGMLTAAAFSLLPLGGTNEEARRPVSGAPPPRCATTGQAPCSAHV